MKVLIEVTLRKASGPNQDADAVAEELDSAIESDVASIYVQDDEHDTESEYEVTNTKVVAVNGVTR